MANSTYTCSQRMHGKPSATPTGDAPRCARSPSLLTTFNCIKLHYTGQASMNLYKLARFFHFKGSDKINHKTNIELASYNMHMRLREYNNDAIVLIENTTTSDSSCDTWFISARQIYFHCLQAFLLSVVMAMVSSLSNIPV